MFRKRIAKSTLLVLLALVVASAAPALAYTYYASFAVTEANGTDYAMLALRATSNNDWMAANGFMAADALDTTIETLGGLVKPHMVTETTTLTAIPVPGASQTNLYFTTGNTPAVLPMDIITGYNGFITTAHHANLELGNEAVIDLQGYIATTAVGDVDIVSKTDAFELYVSAATDITAETYFTNTETLRPDGHNTCVIPNEVGAVCNNHWQNVDEVVADDLATMVFSQADAATYIDYYTLDNTAIPAGYIITAVTVYIRGEVNNVLCTYSGDLKLGANIETGTLHNNLAWATYNESLARPGGGPWLQTDLDSLLIGVKVTAILGGNNVYVTQTYVEVSYLIPIDVTVTGVTSGIRQIEVDLDPAGAGTMTLSVWNDAAVHQGNSPQNVGLAGNSVPVVPGSAWVLMSNATPYLEYYSHTTAVAGVSEKIRYEPTDIVAGTALINENAPGTYNGVITWGANPAGVAVALGSMTSTSQPSIGADTTAPSADILPGIGVSDWYVAPAVGVGESLRTNPLRPLVLLLVADPVPGSPSSAPLNEIQAWRLLALAMILFLTVAAGVAVRGHLFLAGIVAGASIGGAVALTIFPLWALVFAIGAVAAGVVAERSPSL